MPAGDASAFPSGTPPGGLEGSSHYYLHLSLRLFSVNHHLYLIRVSQWSPGERQEDTLDMSSVITVHTHTHTHNLVSAIKLKQHFL